MTVKQIKMKNKTPKIKKKQKKTLKTEPPISFLVQRCVAIPIPTDCRLDIYSLVDVYTTTPVLKTDRQRLKDGTWNRHACWNTGIPFYSS